MKKSEDQGVTPCLLNKAMRINWNDRVLKPQEDKRVDMLNTGMHALGKSTLKIFLNLK